MQPHQQRVVDEKAELDKKIEGLRTFIKSDRFTSVDENERGRLNYQLHLMTRYSGVLDERITAFT